MSNLLEEYEESFGVLTAEITSNIGRLSIVSIGNYRIILNLLILTLLINHFFFNWKQMTGEI